MALKSNGHSCRLGSTTTGQINVPTGVSNITALAPGVAQHALVIHHQVFSPVISVDGVIACNGASLTNLNASSITAGTLSGNGVNLTNLNATNLYSGHAAAGQNSVPSAYQWGFGSDAFRRVHREWRWFDQLELQQHHQRAVIVRHYQSRGDQ